MKPHLRPVSVGDDELMAQRGLTEEPGGDARGMCLAGRLERLATAKQGVPAQRDDGAGKAHAVPLPMVCARCERSIPP